MNFTKEPRGVQLLLSLPVVLLVAALAAPLFGAPPRPTVAIVDFRNVTGDAAAVTDVMIAVRHDLAQRGFDVVGNAGINGFLREHRIRARDALTLEQVRHVATLVGARYVLIGAVDTWTDNGGPEIGLTARIIDSADGSVKWAGEASLHAVATPGLLAMGRPRTLEAATERAARRLFSNLVLKKKGGALTPQMPHRQATRPWLAPVPIAFRSPNFDPTKPLLVAVLPLENQSSSPRAPLVVGDRLLSRLLALPNVDVVDPGTFRQALIDNDIQPLFGVSPSQMQALKTLLGIDALVDGSILRYDNGTGAVPSIDLFIRLRDTQTGEILWSATTARNGERTRSLYDVGRIRGIDRLAESALSELLSTWTR